VNQKISVILLARKLLNMASREWLVEIAYLAI